MDNPILKKQYGILLYAAWWILVSGIHFAVLHYFHKQEIAVSIIDSLTSNILFAILSIGLWFWVRYSDIEQKRIWVLIINHAGTAALSIFAWASLSQLLLAYIQPSKPNYLLFLSDSIPWRAITGTFLYITTILFYYLTIYISNFRDKLSKEAELKELARDAELNWLKLQINPHFLFNSLNSISSLTLSDPDKAQDMIIRLSELLRYSLKQAPQSSVPVIQEIENCTRYLDIERVRFGSRLTYSINLNKDAEEVKIPSMLLQPVFENAIKHGIASTVDPGHISASIEKQGSIIIIAITNTFNPEVISSKSTGVGLANIRRRLMLFFERNDLLSVTKTEKSFTTTLRIPILKSDANI